MPFQIKTEKTEEFTKLTVGFDPADQQTNAEMVSDVASRIDGMIGAGELQGSLLLITGPMSVPLCCVISHKVSHLFGAVGVFDPKLEGYVISISHSPDYELGQVLSISELV